MGAINLRFVNLARIGITHIKARRNKRVCMAHLSSIHHIHPIINTIKIIPLCFPTDWSNLWANKIFVNLKKDGDRMNIYDISDVAYDAFLLNGHSKWHPWTARVKVGDVVRLRFIGAAASTIYQVKIPKV